MNSLQTNSAYGCTNVSYMYYKATLVFSSFRWSLFPQDMAFAESQLELTFLCVHVCVLVQCTCMYMYNEGYYMYMYMCRGA